MKLNINFIMGCVWLGALVILSLGLMAISEGSLVIVFLILGMFIAIYLFGFLTTIVLMEVGLI